MVCGITARDCASGLHVSISMCFAARGGLSDIAARGRVSRVYSRSIDVWSNASGMLESGIVFIATRNRVSGMYEKKITPGVSSEVEQRSIQLQMGTRAIYYRVAARGSVSGRHVSSISVYYRLGHCVRYRRQGQSVRYGTRAVSPSGAPHSLSGMHAAIRTSRGRFRRSHNDRYITIQRGSLARPKEVVLGSTASRVSLSNRVPMCEIAW